MAGQGFAVGRAFAATGTPIAALVDADGKVASEVVTGAQAVLALARSDQARQATATGRSRRADGGER
jgi:hypothetical protein